MEAVAFENRLTFPANAPRVPLWKAGWRHPASRYEYRRGPRGPPVGL